QNAGQQDHQGGEAIHHQHDSERHRPVAQPVNPQHRLVRAVGHAQQGNGYREQQQGGGYPQSGLDHAAPFADDHHRRSGEERDDNGRNREAIQPAVHWTVSRPSTWAGPVRPRAARSATRKSAVVAKLMTMAVRTSACGSGSACCARSPAVPGSRIGAAPMRSPPVEKMNRLTAYESSERPMITWKVRGRRISQTPEAVSRPMARDRIASIMLLPPSL